MKKACFATLLFAIALSFSLLSCKTYYIPVDTFEEQLRSAAPSQVRDVHMPFHVTIPFYTNALTYITCVDNEGNVYELKNSPSIEMRVTQHSGKRTLFYFDTVLLQDSLLVGKTSRFLALEKSIPLSSIKQIEVQDGHKNFTYKGEKKALQNDSLY